MPYRIVKKTGPRPFRIIRKADGREVGSSTSLAFAKASIRARMSGENK